MGIYCNHCMSEIPTHSVFCPQCGQATAAKLVPGYQLLPGTVLNRRYQVGYSIGVGGFGITYIGRDLTLQKRVAIKEYYPLGIPQRDNRISSQIQNIAVNRIREYEDGKKRFLEEARVLAMFSGEAGVVSAHDFFEANSTAYIIMDYVEGQTLQAFLTEKGLLSADETKRLMLPVMKVVKKLHDQGRLHRDLSPDNLMLTADGLKILDFGAACSMTMESGQNVSAILKKGYAPQEQYRSKGNLGPWTDIYALGATMYKCLTGITPDEAIERVFADNVKPITEHGIDIPRNMEQAIMKAMSIMPETRFQNMATFMEALIGAESTPLIAPDVQRKKSEPELLFTSDESVAETRETEEKVVLARFISCIQVLAETKAAKRTVAPKAKPEAPDRVQSVPKSYPKSANIVSQQSEKIAPVVSQTPIAPTVPVKKEKDSYLVIWSIVLMLLLGTGVAVIATVMNRNAKDRKPIDQQVGMNTTTSAQPTQNTQAVTPTKAPSKQQNYNYHAYLKLITPSNITRMDWDDPNGGNSWYWDSSQYDFPLNEIKVTDANITRNGKYEVAISNMTWNGNEFGQTGRYDLLGFRTDIPAQVSITISDVQCFMGGRRVDSLSDWRAEVYEGYWQVWVVNKWFSDEYTITPGLNMDAEYDPYVRNTRITFNIAIND